MPNYDLMGPYQLPGTPVTTGPDEHGFCYRQIYVKIDSSEPHRYLMAFVTRWQRLIDVAIEVLCMQSMKGQSYDQAKGEERKFLRFLSWDATTQTASFETTSR